MRRLPSFVLGLAAILVVPLLVAARPARADMDETFRVDCTHDYAEWTWSDARLDPSPTAHVATKPKNTSTYIFACRMGVHDVRMNFDSQPWPWGHCGGVDIDHLSVWVDGAKIVDNRQIGEMSACQHGNDPVPNKIIINDKLRLTMCEIDVSSEAPPPPCRLTTLDLSGKPKDARRTGNVVRTEPALLLVDDRAPALCRTLTEEANLSLREGDDDDIYWKHGMKDVYTSQDDDQDFPRGKAFTLDVDNDGVPDTLATTVGRSLRQFAWRSGASGKTMTVDTTLLGYENTNYFAGEVSDFLGFVRISGKTYLYEGDFGLISNYPGVPTAEIDAMNGAAPGPQSPTHRLFALTPDGRADLICSWAPRQRPEEYL